MYIFYVYNDVIVEVTPQNIVVAYNSGNFDFYRSM